MLKFGRDEVERGRIGAAVDRLPVLGDSPAAIAKLEGRMRPMVSGYDADPRELYEIPEVRRFFRAVVDAWGGWLYFLDQAGDSIPLLMALLIDVEVVAREHGMVGWRPKDPTQLAAALQRLFDGLNVLCRHHGIADAECLRITRQVGAVTDRMLGRAGSPKA